MQSEAMKAAAARTAVEYVAPGEVLGVGSGSTVAALIAAMAPSTARPRAAVPASDASAALLTKAGIPVVTLDDAGGSLRLHIDGADEMDPDGRMIKGGGGAHTREKSLARASAVFLCIADESKLVARLGLGWPVPLEYLDGAAERVTAEVRALGGELRPRLDARGDAVRADSGNPLGDIFGLTLDDLARAETDVEAIEGVVACGIFAHRQADAAIIARADGTVDREAFTKAGTRLLRGMLGGTTPRA